MKQGYLSWGLLILLSMIWGSSFILIKKGLLELSAIEVGGLRILSASLFLTPFALTRLKRVSKKHWLPLISVGFTGSLLPAFLFALAQTEISSSMAGILNALTPIFTILIGYLIYRKSFSLMTIVGMAIGFVGTILLITSGGTQGFTINLYGLLVILATICYGLNGNIIKYRLSDLSSLTITSISLIMVGPFVLIYLIFKTNLLTRSVTADQDLILSLGAIVILGVIGTAIALIIFNQLVKITQPVFASSVTYIIPIVAVIWGLIDEEKLFLTDYVGLFAIVSGVYLANTNRLRRLRALN